MIRDGTQYQYFMKHIPKLTGGIFQKGFALFVPNEPKYEIT